VLEEVRDGLPEPRVRLDAIRGDLVSEAGVQPLHHGTAVRLMPREPGDGGQPVLARVRVVVIDVAQRFQHVPTFGRKARRDLHEFAPGVGEAMAEDDLQRLRRIPRQRIAHLNRRAEIRGPLGEQRLLGRRAEEELAQTGNRRGLALEQFRHVAQRVDRGFERLVLGVTEWRLPGPLDQALEVIHVQLDPQTRRRQLTPRSAAAGSAASADSRAPL